MIMQVQTKMLMILKIKKSCINNTITKGKEGKGNRGVKDDCIPFDACHQLFVSGK